MSYLYWGKVIRGKNRGKTLGFPTINIRLHTDIPEGVYVSQTKINGKIYKSVSFIGAAKTFNEKEIFGETFILDFNRNLYGKWISVRLINKLRGNKKFSSPEELVEQIKKDITESVKYFSLKNNPK